MLDLSWSALSGAALGAVLKALEENTSVRTVNLCGYAPPHEQRISELQRLLALLERKSGVRELNLSYAGIDDAAMTQLVAPFITRTKSLTTLNLAFNALTESGVSALIAALKENRTVQNVVVQLPSMEEARLAYWTERLYMMRERKA